MLIGDMLEILAAFLWGATTLYIKKYLAEKMHPINTFLYQLVFSIPVLFLWPFFIEPVWLKDPGRWRYRRSSSSPSSSLRVILVWFKLIHDYPSRSSLSSPSSRPFRRGIRSPLPEGGIDPGPYRRARHG
jgi:hypothetical protein